jgi:glutathione S-transferase
VEKSSTDQIRLISGNRNYSSWSLRAWLCLRKAGLDPEVTVLPMDSSEFEARIGEYSPTRRVPVLWIGDEPIWDSLAIAESINERYAGGMLWPEDARLRARGRAIAAEMHSGFSALRRELPMNCRAVNRSLTISAEVVTDIQRICEIWRSTLAYSASDSGWLLGAFTIADAMFAPVALRFRGYAVELPADARRYVEHWLADDHLQNWIDLAAQEPWIIEHEEVGDVPG